MRATLFTNKLLMALSGRQLPPRDMSAVGEIVLQNSIDGGGEA